MKKQILKPVLVLFVLVSMAFIAFVSFSTRVDAKIVGGHYIWHDGHIIGCVIGGYECDFIIPDPEPDN